MSLLPLVQWNTSANTVIVNGVYHRGLTDVLKSTFYPSYNVQQSNRGPKGPALAVRPHRSQGKYLGRRVDQELKQFYDHKNPSCCAESTAVINYLADQKLQVVYSQFPVADSDLRLCTAIDLVTQTPDGTLVLIEVKTGYHNYRHRFQRTMAGPYQQLNDSPYHQHQLQLLLSTRLFRDSFPSQICRAELLYTTPHGVTVHPLLEIFNDSMMQITRRLLRSSKTETKKIRRRRIRNTVRRTRKLKIFGIPG